MEPKDLKNSIVQHAKELEPYLVKIRRQIHMNPETAYEEIQTSKLIESELKKMGYETEKTAKTGIIAILDSQKDGSTVALRADIDALNITEENTDKEYCSKIQGKMHACGHDGHIAMLLGAAKLLRKFKDEIRWTGKIKLIFQPAEEGGGGGKRIVEEGHLDDVDYVFGIHLWRELPSGTIATRKGGILASADEFEVTITGKGGHAAAPQQAIDPTSVLIDIYNAIHKVVSREIDPFADVVITTPVLQGSDAFNVIPPKAILKGTFRTMDIKVREHIISRLKEIVEGYSQAWRCKGEIEFNPGNMIAYPPLVNDPDAVDIAIKILKELDEVKIAEASMGGEDFAFYTQKTKGAFLLMGIENKEKGITAPHHHPKFDLDEDILWKGAAIHTLLGFMSVFKTD
ncbi:MAG: M20 metallopeptidase family protein [Candidatus Hodarchaeales archaeon]